jgi:hypothetical protein
MGKSTRKVAKRHPLLVYQRVSHRLRTTPLLTVFVGLLLLGLSFLGSFITLEGVDISMLGVLEAGQPVIVLLIVASALLYIFVVFIGRNSYVEARPKMLHIQTGLLAINISYRRIRQIRLSQVSIQHPENTLRGGDRSIVEALGGLTCSIVDLASWPWPGLGVLKRLWVKLMFSGDGDNLMIVVRDAMIFNQQVDGRIADVLQRSKQQQSRYVDPLERAAQAQGKTRR